MVMMLVNKYWASRFNFFRKPWSIAAQIAGIRNGSLGITNTICNACYKIVDRRGNTFRNLNRLVVIPPAGLAHPVNTHPLDHLPAKIQILLLELLIMSFNSQLSSSTSRIPISSSSDSYSLSSSLRKRDAAEAFDESGSYYWSLEIPANGRSAEKDYRHVEW